MRRSYRFSGAAIALALGVLGAGCSQTEPSAPTLEPSQSSTSATGESGAPAKIMTATLRAAGMT